MSCTMHYHSDPAFSDATLQKAFEAPLCAYGRVNSHSELCGSAAFLYLLLYYRHNDAATFADGTSVRARILAHFRTLIMPGHEPGMCAGPYWGYPLTAAALTLLRKTPSLWNVLSAEEQGKADDIMRCFAVQCAWATNDCNDFWTGPELAGNYRKGWNPNHRSPGVLPIMFAVTYFGSADAVNDMLLRFDYDAFTAHLADIGFTSALASVTKAGKKLMEEGGPCALLDGTPAGEGKGIRAPYVYRGIPLSDTEGLLDEILLQNCCGGKVVNEVFDENGNRLAYLLDGTSPVLGEEGMMTEFVSHDAKGMRSDISYCSANFCILIPTAAAAAELGIWSPDADRNKKAATLTAVSTVDFLYKMVHGYYSFSHGKGRNTDESNAPHGVYPFAKDLWYACFS